jgi:hypothetical protein
VQVVDPAPGVPGLEARADLPAASQGAICAAQEAVPVEDLLDSTIERRVVCAETLDCGHCCGTHGSLKKFWACCNSGGGLACADACKRY